MYLRHFTFCLKEWLCLLRLEHNLSPGMSYRTVTYQAPRPYLNGLLTQRKLSLLNEEKIKVKLKDEQDSKLLRLCF